MKVSREQVEENRERIIDVAARLFRERGLDGIGVADLMKEAGLTHGGFYGHFKSKEDLIAQAAGRAQANSAQRWVKVIDEAPGDPMQALGEHFLSSRHRDRVGKGCIFAALGPELSRQKIAVRHSVTEGLRPFIDILTKIVPGRSKAERRTKALATYASLVGGMVIARAVDDTAFSEEVLRAVGMSLPKAEIAKPRQKRRSTRVARPQ
jgi:TetR/AcrR family transcriptional repressor of nem operon